MTTATPLDLDRLTIDDVRAGALRGRLVTVLGFARSGVAAARFLHDAGARVRVYDARGTDALADSFRQLEGREVERWVGPRMDRASSWEGASLIVASPSVNEHYPTTDEFMRNALRDLRLRREAGDPTAPPLLSEPDLFLRLCPSVTIGVTGTKGKTTTSSLIAAVLGADPSHRTILGGNIGIPLVERLPDLRADDRVVIELSELQLPTLSRGTHVAVYTNVTSDHLDRHGSLEAYRAAKRRLAELVDPAGALILNDDDPVVAGYARDARARVIGYRAGEPPAGGVGVVDGRIVGDDGTDILGVDELAIPGAHNVSNALAAVATARFFGLAPAAIRGAAIGFHGVEHRLETVATIDGVRFVNDSQGTQPDAVIAALRAFDAPIVLIAGGRDKGVDLSGLPPVVAERAAAAVLIGETGPALERLFRAAGLATIRRAATLESAVRVAEGLAREEMDRRGASRESHPGAERMAPAATVLLSPAAASFDMFVDYAARGRAFKDVVAAIAAEQSGRDR
ncbi:MAG TPA: UDP-N-acetylmuramoyl-L-alanine--D-glutamate ligase [Candidatus Limnocylindrales bacterium]|nr:UDP-N-acetylmuramoyl-L-alanine--D-glutamate ligase [Candidatus Limnocylindrales bacterium]